MAFSRAVRLIAFLGGDISFVLFFLGGFAFGCRGYFGRLNATVISCICSSDIPSGSNPMFLAAM